MDFAPEHKDFYQKLRTKISAWLETKPGKSHKYAKYIMLAPDLFHLLVKLSLDSQVPLATKAKIVAAISYFVMPFDLVPEALLGVIGYADDVVLATLALNGLREIDPKIVQKHWAGEGDINSHIDKILGIANSMVGRTIFSRLKKR